MTLSPAAARRRLRQVRSNLGERRQDASTLDALIHRLLPLMSVDDPEDSRARDAAPISTAAARLLGNVMHDQAGLSLMGAWPRDWLGA
jgi:hypothetical protein